MPLSDDDLKYTLSIESDASRVNAAMDNLAKRADDIGKRVGEAMVRGMSGSGGDAAMQRRGPDPMAALTTGAEQDRLLRESLSAASPLLQRLNAYRESQEKKSAAARRSEFVSGLGRAAAGEAIGSIGGLGGIGAMVAGGVSPAAVVVGAMEVVKKPFDVLARTAHNSAGELAALNTSLGAAAAGFEQAANKWRWVPLIGDQMASVFEAERSRAAVFRNSIGLASPGDDYRLRYAQQTAEATQGAAELRRIRSVGGSVDSVARATEMAGLLEGELRQRGDEYRPWYRRGWLGSGPFRTAEQNRRNQEASELSRQLEYVRNLGMSGIGVTPQIEEGIRRQLGKAGIKAEQTTPPALPAQITGIEEFLTNLYTTAASLGPQGKAGDDPQQVQRNIFDVLSDIRDAVQNWVGGHADNAVSRVVDASISAASVGPLGA